MPFWESSIFWGIAGIVGGFIVAAFFFYVGKAKKSLIYQISTSALITRLATLGVPAFSAEVFWSATGGYSRL